MCVVHIHISSNICKSTRSEVKGGTKRRLEITTHTAVSSWLFFREIRAISLQCRPLQSGSIVKHIFPAARTSDDPADSFSSLYTRILSRELNGIQRPATVLRSLGLRIHLILTVLLGSHKYILQEKTHGIERFKSHNKLFMLPQHQKHVPGPMSLSV